MVDDGSPATRMAGPVLKARRPLVCLLRGAAARLHCLLGPTATLGRGLLGALAQVSHPLSLME